MFSNVQHSFPCSKSLYNNAQALGIINQLVKLFHSKTLQYKPLYSLHLKTVSRYKVKVVQMY